MKSELSPIRENSTASLSHHRFMKMASQVMAEFDKIDAILSECLSTRGEQDLAA
ncbi:hypothetical protein [Dyella ginsengisoli]|uniref:hypothetical protein n=1 Tax=Dyella ginsengisoli TaxID=363848 RepID=UPI00034AE209|nr:hypothetical protein [Dyella ginsengisoli]